MKFAYKKRARYRGHANVQFQFFMDALVHNMKRLVAIHPFISGRIARLWVIVPKNGRFHQVLAKSTAFLTFLSISK